MTGGITPAQLDGLKLDLQEAIYRAMVAWAREIPERHPGGNLAGTVLFDGSRAVRVHLHPASPPGQPALAMLEARITSPRLT